MGKQVSKPGVYRDIAMADYVADPAPEPSLNASCATTILTQSPRHAWAQHPRLNPQPDHDESSRLDLGTIAHGLLLEGDESKVVVIAADDWRKKEAKELRDAARADGKLPILTKDYDGAHAMVIAARKAIAETEIGADFAAAVPEQTLIWEEEGIWLRCRPDKATKDWRAVFDYKTCVGSAHPQVWSKSALIRYGYDLQAAINLRGVEKLGKARRTTFVFVVQEIEAPYAVSLVSLTPRWLDLAEAKLKRAMSIWKGCIRTNEWPGYTGQIAYMEPPAYAEVGWDEYLPQIDAEDLI